MKGHRLLVETYCHQVKICIEIALNCVEADRNKRPNIGDVISVLNKTENKIHDAGKLLHALIDDVCTRWNAVSLSRQKIIFSLVFTGGSNFLVLY